MPFFDNTLRNGQWVAKLNVDVTWVCKRKTNCKQIEP
jgi:hypothetical protein